MARAANLVRRAGEAAILAALLLTALPAPVAAESTTAVLTEDAHSAVAADLDGDGTKEMVAIVSEPQRGSPLRLAAWTVRGGRWISLGEEPVVRWVEADEQERTARLREDAAALLSLRDGSRTRVVVAVGELYRDDSNPGACCLSFADVRLLGSADLDLELVPRELGSAESITVVDMEADGREELLVTSWASSVTRSSFPQHTLLRQSGADFVAEPVPIPDDEAVWFSAAGETDGIAGEDLLFGHESLRRMVRVTSRDAGLHAEVAPAIESLQPPGGGWIVGAAQGVLVIASDKAVTTARWPRDGAPEQVDEQPRNIWPTLFLLGTGADARIVELTGVDIAADDGRLGIRVLDLELRLERELEATSAVGELLAATQSASMASEPMPNFHPQMGPINGGLPDGRAAFLGLGWLLEIGPDGAHEAREAPQFAGGEVMGLAGPDSGWLAYATGWVRSGGRWAWMGDPGFGDDQEVLDARVTVAPLDAVLGSRSDAAPPVTLRGAAEVELQDGPMLFTGPEGFTATVTGEPGTLVVTTAGQGTQAAEIEDRPLNVTVDLDVTRANAARDVTMVLIDPGGVARSIGWDVTVVTEPPGVTATSSFELFDGHASVVGSVGVGTTVTVDGQPVYVTQAGDFGTVVDASPWPREVAVVARDPLGNEQVRRLEVVGIADVRALPWIPIFVLLTMAAGVVLFLRVPTVRADRRMVPDGDGLLEELDGDSI